MRHQSFLTNDATIIKINPRLTGDQLMQLLYVIQIGKTKIEPRKAVSINDFIENLPGYKPQNLTLNFMISFLFVISATVIGIFLYVMTLQKTSLFGILKAQEFTNGYLANACNFERSY